MMKVKREKLEYLDGKTLKIRLVSFCTSDDFVDEFNGVLIICFFKGLGFQNIKYFIVMLYLPYHFFNRIYLLLVCAQLIISYGFYDVHDLVRKYEGCLMGHQ